jgi:acetyltransferase-like isoleucine patch superfamily enzyme
VIQRNLRRLRKVIVYLPNKWRYQNYHITAHISRPLLLTPRYISVGKGVIIEKHCRIQGIIRYNDVRFEPSIVFGDYATCQQNLHLTCASRISIGKNTAIAANVTITDINHPYENVDLPIERQDIEVSEVIIGEDCKIYNNAVILPGTNIGKHCVVGANSVVRGVFPDFSVIAGIPAKIIRQYNKEIGKWMSVQ